MTTPYVPAPADGPVPASGMFGRYVLLGEAKAGGMGVVYKARDTALDRVVALKMLKTGGQAGPDEVARFQREARAVGRLKHPNIVPVYDVGKEQGLHYLTMEFVGGGSLAEHLERFADQPRAAARLVEKVARAVHCAHEHHILHRDLKPGNILLDESGEPHVTDFGLAKVLDGSPHPDRVGPGSITPEEQGLHPSVPLGSSQTEVHTIGAVGTPLYMAPEQLNGGVVTPAADVWGLGVILYRLLTGRLPFASPDATTLTEQVVGQAPPLPRTLCPGLDPALQAICLKCLEKEPAKRYRSAEELAADLVRWLQGGERLPARTWRLARRRPLLAAALAVVFGALAVGALVALWPTDPDRRLRSIQNELAQGKPVTLIGPTGPPAWLRWLGGETTAKVVPSPDDCFTISTQSTALLELLPDPMTESYRFRAEVKQQPGPVSWTGLYFGHSTVDTETATLHFTCEWTFCDSYAGGTREAHLRCCQFAPYLKMPAQEAWAFYGTGMEPTREAWDWCGLEMEVRPREIHLVWRGPEVVEQRFPREQLPRDFTRWTTEPARDRFERLGFTPASPQPSFAARGGLGIFIEACAASFRNVVVEPLTDGD